MRIMLGSFGRRYEGNERWGIQAIASPFGKSAPEHEAMKPIYSERQERMRLFSNDVDRMRPCLKEAGTCSDTKRSGREGGTFSQSHFPAKACHA